MPELRELEDMPELRVLEAEELLRVPEDMLEERELPEEERLA